MEMKEFKEDIDSMIADSLRQPPDFIIPASFTENLVKKLEKQLAWKELLSEFGLKAGLVLAALIVMLICLVFPAKNDPVPWLDWIAKNRFIVTGLIGVVMFTVLFDQILLKFMFRKTGKSF
ncbi:MAG: hypothetical protein WCI48_02940 [Bacteroidota bacterium]